MVVSEALRAAIRDGQFRPGDKLPSEAQLALAHQVSRTVIREAIAQLRADGLVLPRQGAGIFVQAAEAALSLPFKDVDPARLSSVIEMLELRVPVEIEAAGLAAQRRSPAQEEAILEAHRAIGRCIEAEAPTAEADFRLHLAIAEATNNPRFAEFLRMSGPRLIPRAVVPQGERVAHEAGYLDRLMAEHARIVDAISSGDVPAAREAMRVHLKGSQQRYRDIVRHH